MIKKLIRIFLVSIALIQAQDTFEFYGEIQFNNDGLGYGGSDVWGYVSPDGVDYAIMGILEGVVFIRAEDLMICDTVLGPMESDPYYHRDIKTFGHYAFVVSENTGVNEGIQIIDMSGLPESVELVDMYVHNDQVESHNFSIDVATGFAYVLSQSNEGVRIIDINNPEEPEDVNYIDTEQVHDAFARNDTLYVAEGWRGTFSMYDVSDKTNPNLLARIDIPDNGYVHTIWPSDDGRYVVTTEETVPKTIKVWSIEDLDNVHVVSEYLGDNMVAHNAQVMGPRIFVSHYTFGMVILDFSDPLDLVVSAYYDTYPENDDPSPPWIGNWGIYQYTKNNYVYGSDIDGKFTIMKYYKGLDHGTIYGDVNGDEIVNIMDLTGLVNIVLNNQIVTNDVMEKADVDFNGVLNVFDILRLSEMILTG